MRESDTLITRLKYLRQQVNELKGTQYLAGDGWIVYRIITNDTYDVDTTVATGEIKQWLVTFTPAVDRLSVNNLQYISDSSGSFSSLLIPKYGTYNQWYFTARKDSAFGPTATVKEKFVLSSTVEGTLAVTPL